MTSVKDLERCARLFEKEVSSLAGQLAERESSLRQEVDRLRADLRAVQDYLSGKDPSFPGGCLGEAQGPLRPPGEPGGR